ncbi:MAG: chorismate-binding protein, partial [Cyanobacteriota bacterium]
DHREQILWLAVSDFRDLKVLNQRLDSLPAPTVDPCVTPSLEFLQTQQDYEAGVKQALEYIRRGDIFQANLSLRFQTPPTQGGWPVYRRLQSLNPSPFASYWRSPWGEVVSCSPERLVAVRGQQIQTRPIAGTRPRGRSPEEEARLIRELITTPKERAEHIMLVDLERNDLGCLCRWGTVRVDELLAIERYSHVLHLVSNITGELRTTAPGRILTALFPGGTITGCPKVRCLEIIEELEPVRRSLFYGSCGYLDQRGHLDLNILIRTLLFTSQAIVGQVGAGIVADSDPTQEWRESLQKAKALTQALGYDA